MIHVFLQLVGIDKEGLDGLVVLNERVDEGGLLEEIVLLEGVELVELHGIDTQLHVDGWLQQEGLLALVGQDLHAYALQLGKDLASELFNIELGIGLYLGGGSKMPAVGSRRKIGETHVVVGVVDEICLEAGLRQFLDIDWHEGQIGRKLFAAFALFGLRTKRDGHVGRLRLFGRCLLLLLFHLDHVLRVVVLFAYDDHFFDTHWHLEAVFVFDKYNVLTLEAGNTASTYLTQESYFISYFHTKINYAVYCVEQRVLHLFVSF